MDLVRGEEKTSLTLCTVRRGGQHVCLVFWAWTMCSIWKGDGPCWRRKLQGRHGWRGLPVCARLCLFLAHTCVNVLVRDAVCGPSEPGHSLTASHVRRLALGSFSNPPCAPTSLWYTVASPVLTLRCLIHKYDSTWRWRGPLNAIYRALAWW